jgi:hypothetical protein
MLHGKGFNVYNPEKNYRIMVKGPMVCELIFAPRKFAADMLGFLLQPFKENSFNWG